jgi:hypothetical protein
MSIINQARTRAFTRSIMCSRSLAHFVAQSRAGVRAHIAGYERLRGPSVAANIEPPVWAEVWRDPCRPVRDYVGIYRVPRTGTWRTAVRRWRVFCCGLRSTDRNGVVVGSGGGLVVQWLSVRAPYVGVHHLAVRAGRDVAVTRLLVAVDGGCRVVCGPAVPLGHEARHVSELCAFGWS